MDKISEQVMQYSKVIEMCKGTPMEATPWLCVRTEAKNGEGYCYYREHPDLTIPCDREFAVAILEDKPVFVGDTFYSKKHTILTTTGPEYATPRILEEPVRVSAVQGDPVLMFREGIVERSLLVSSFINLNHHFTWTPPVTAEEREPFKLNGIEVPRPVTDGREVRGGVHRLRLQMATAHRHVSGKVGPMTYKKDIYFFFNSPEDLSEFTSALVAILEKAKQR